MCQYFGEPGFCLKEGTYKYRMVGGERAPFGEGLDMEELVNP